MNNLTKLIIGVTAGVVAGAVTGLLLAPDSGKKTRRKIGKESDRLMQTIQESLNEVASATRTKFNSTKDELARKVPSKSISNN